MGSHVLTGKKNWRNTWSSCKQSILLLLSMKRQTILSTNSGSPFLSRESHSIFLPDEIWENIFFMVANSFMHDLGYMEEELRKLACVSQDWSKKIRESTRIIFRNTDPILMTNWVLRQFSDIEKLVCNSTIVNQTMKALTNLKNLDVLNNENVTNKGIAHLSSSLLSLKIGNRCPITHTGLTV